MRMENLKRSTRIFDLLDNLVSQFPDKEDILASKIDESWRKYSVKEYKNCADWFSIGLISLGFNVKDNIATVSNNRPEWNIVDIGMMQVGAVHIPIYPTISDEEYKHILSHSESKILIVSDKDLYKRLIPIASEINAIEEIFTFNKVEGAKNWREIIELGKKNDTAESREKINEIKSKITKDDLATIIYTSGTTGLSKGVMLSHENFLYLVRGISEILDVDTSGKALSFLPLCHVLERIGVYVYQNLGISIYYAESVDKISDNLKEVKPVVFITVPRLLERIYDKILGFGKDLKGITRKIFFWAIDLGLKFELNSANGFLYESQLALANILVFKKWRKVLGGNIRVIISGGAALQPRLARSFWAANIPICEGYGLTETAPVIAVNRQYFPDIKFGTVGPILGKEQEVKIAEDGEILFKGPNLMLGYYKDEEKTKAAIDKDGWFHTGDIGVFENERFLKITDRKKEIFKLSTGKYVAPQVVENVLKESIFIEQVMIVGENEKFVSALISPNFEFLHDWCTKKNIHYRDNKDLIEHHRVIKRYQKEVDFFNEKFGKTEKIKKFHLVCEEWTTENSILSPTLKLRRRFIKKKYKRLLDNIYQK